MITAYYTLAELAAAEQVARAALDTARQALLDLAIVQRQGMAPDDQITTASAAYTRLETARAAWAAAAGRYAAAHAQSARGV